jgi:uncharacterized protein
MSIFSSWASGLILGLAGSLHCVGMCGPLMLLLPSHQSWRQTVSSQGVYHLGKTLTYVLMGLIIGFVFIWVDIRRFEQQFSLILGFLFLLLWMYEFWGNKRGSYSPLQNWVQRAFGNTIQKKATWGWFLGGMLNGLLPCGLVYGALMASLGTGSQEGTIFFMLGFGMGTSPALLGISLGKSIVSKSFLPKLKNTLPYWLLLMALLFFLRGANLGIPFVSPKFEKGLKPGQTKSCCH